MVDEQSLRQHNLGQVLRVSSQLTIMCGEHPFVLSSFGRKGKPRQGIYQTNSVPRIKEKQAVLLIDRVDRLLSVRLKGLEPPRLAASDPKSDVATNYTTAACVKHVAHGQGFCNCVAKVVIISVVANTAHLIIGRYGASSSSTHPARVRGRARVAVC